MQNIQPGEMIGSHRAECLKVGGTSSHGGLVQPTGAPRLGRNGAAVRIWATDDVQGVGVSVSVLDEEGNSLEQ